MKIKRFFASEMREAIRQVKAELGADAVILSNNKVDGGIELVAAIDYDEEVVQRSVDASRDRQSLKSAPISRKKSQSPISARVKKQKITARLEDSIADDVISFSGTHTAAEKQKGKVRNFASILKQSKKNHIAKKPQTEKKLSNDVYKKPSLQDRKQPYISDAADFEQKSNSYYSDNISGEDNYPFDYESLVKEEHLSRQKKQHTKSSRDNDKLDDFYTDHKSKRAPASVIRNKNNSTGKKIEWVEDPAITSMHEEIKSLRGILENQLSGLAWGDFARRHPHRAELLSRLYRLGIKSSLSEKLVKQIKNSESLEGSWRSLLGAISRHIPMIDYDLIDEGGIIALVGPTGVGKTTNIAKMAARYTLKYGAKNLALVTTDSYRVGAHEQLKTYGRILGVPVYVADDEQELKQVLSRLDDKQLILIDTAGMSHRDLRLAEQLSMLRQSHDKMKILAVLSAASQSLVMDEVIKAFNVSELDGCIASKVDESTSIGGIISVLIENQLQLNYISDGQKVPEDLHLANATDLLKQALGMVREHPTQIKTDELAMSFSGDGLARAFA
ncbi:MAG: flagellar biosynthesis protein FlhF [gamma proteobacterium symbiont of Taylorina sp.]|nr:flagellar biosynthesis protein FlhF [gamma proteobacterium symbiont of Taylorina sp.]